MLSLSNIADYTKPRMHALWVITVKFSRSKAMAILRWYKQLNKTVKTLFEHAPVLCSSYPSDTFSKVLECRIGIEQCLLNFQEFLDLDLQFHLIQRISFYPC